MKSIERISRSALRIIRKQIFPLALLAGGCVFALLIAGKIDWAPVVLLVWAGASLLGAVIRATHDELTVNEKNIE